MGRRARRGRPNVIDFPHDTVEAIAAILAADMTNLYKTAYLIGILRKAQDQFAVWLEEKAGVADAKRLLRRYRYPQANNKGTR